ncbi:MAG: hypothetical protein RSD22_10265 [Romboutsia sp.]
MNNSNKDIKPFYVYTDKNYLYIKNINSHTEKLYNNVYTYCANIDANNRIHICCIDTAGKLIHISSNNNHWKKKVVGKVFDNIKNIKNMRLYIVNNFLNIFVVEENPLSEGLHRVSHFNINPKNHKMSKYYIKNIYKENSSIYKLNLDGLSNFIFQYKSLSPYSRDYIENTLIFNSTSQTWLNPCSIPRCSNSDNTYPTSDIKDNIFEYCYSLVYKI